MFFFQTFGRAHCTCLSLQRPLLSFTSSPQGHLLTPYNPAVTSPHPAEWNIPSHSRLCYYFIPLLLCSIRTNPSSGADPNTTMSRTAICVLTGSAGGTLWIAAKTIHSHGVPHTPMLFHSFILETRRNGLIHHRLELLQIFSCSF